MKKQGVLFYSAGSELSRHEKPLGSTQEKNVKCFPVLKTFNRPKQNGCLKYI